VTHRSFPTRFSAWHEIKGVDVPIGARDDLPQLKDMIQNYIGAYLWYTLDFGGVSTNEYINNMIMKYLNGTVGNVFLITTNIGTITVKMS
jgi:hypothetical protein